MRVDQPGSLSHSVTTEPVTTGLYTDRSMRGFQCLLKTKINHVITHGRDDVCSLTPRTGALQCGLSKIKLRDVM